jgi:hypothetical protein
MDWVALTEGVMGAPPTITGGWSQNNTQNRMIMSLSGGDVCTTFINSTPFRRRLGINQTVVIDSKDDETDGEAGLTPR